VRRAGLLGAPTAGSSVRLDVLAIGLTGGIGSGKSTVGELLVRCGAVLIDADVIARQVLEKDSPGLARVIERFGDGLLREDGSLDREKTANLVFADEMARADLDAIVHPLVAARMLEAVAGEAETDHVVVLDIPLLAEGGRSRYQLDGVLVVDCPVDIAIERLVEQRGMSPADAEARVAAQATREERLALADFIIMNMGTRQELEEMVNRAWAWMNKLASSAGSRPAGV
jgi:dephospho-CoA kinase